MITLYEIVKAMKELSSDIRWMKWLLGGIFLALIVILSLASLVNAQAIDKCLDFSDRVVEVEKSKVTCITSKTIPTMSGMGQADYIPEMIDSQALDTKLVLIKFRSSGSLTLTDPETKKQMVLKVVDIIGRETEFKLQAEIIKLTEELMKEKKEKENVTLQLRSMQKENDKKEEIINNMTLAIETNNPNLITKEYKVNEKDLIIALNKVNEKQFGSPRRWLFEYLGVISFTVLVILYASYMRKVKSV